MEDKQTRPSNSLLELPMDLDLTRTILDQVGGFVASRTSRRTSFSETLKKELVSSEAHFGRLQRLNVYQQAACQERDFNENLRRTEMAAEKNTVLMMDYFNWSWHNR